MVSTYRKKPIEVEAVQFWLLSPDVGGDDGEAIALWCGGRIGGQHLLIETLEGLMTATEGDWIIKGVKGEFYPCKSDIFETTYDAVAMIERMT